MPSMTGYSVYLCCASVCCLGVCVCVRVCVCWLVGMCVFVSGCVLSTRGIIGVAGNGKHKVVCFFLFSVSHKLRRTPQLTSTDSVWRYRCSI